jgi:hypothetical protein
MKNATATSHGKSRLLAADGLDEDGGLLMELTPVRDKPSAFHFQTDQPFNRGTAINLMFNFTEYLKHMIECRHLNCRNILGRPHGAYGLHLGSPGL